MSEPDILYHYCSLDTFFNIIKNRTLWLSDISKSNDSNELILLKKDMHATVVAKYASYLDELVKTVEEKVKENYEYVSECLSKSKIIKEHFENNISFLSTENNYLNTWGICFSEEGDLLSQWRGYADDAQGISIGFSKDYFKTSCELLSEEPLILMKLDKVHYSEEYVKSIISNNAKLYSLNLESSPEEVAEVLGKVLSITSRESPFYKKSSFSEEREWRLSISNLFPGDFDKSSYLDALKKSNSSLFPLEIKDWNYIVKQGGLVSYIELYLNNIEQAISSIIIGPKSKCSVADIKAFLIFHGLLKDKCDKSIEVKKSDSSYR